MSTDSLNQSPLGKAVAYNAHYDPKLLFSLPRATQREQLQLPTQWYGQDVWNAYELSWLGPNGCPQVALARFTLPHDSPCLIESKSLKLYLNSLDRKSTRLNSSHVAISYAVFCLKKKTQT